jgi:hypothetical protein
MPLLLGAVVALVLGLGAGAAYGYFTSTGHGSGTASTGTAASVTVNEATGTVSTPLFPGSTGDMLVSLTNPNSYAVTITSITLNGTITPDSGHPSCTTAGVTLQTLTGLSINVTSGTDHLDISNAVAMGASSSNGCQSATFQVPVTITMQKG